MHRSLSREPRNARSTSTKDYNILARAQKFNRQDKPSMAPRPSRPRADAVVGTYEHVADIHGIVAVCVTAYKLPVNEGAPITAPVMCAQGV